MVCNVRKSQADTVSRSEQALRIAIWVAMVTMHFHIAQMSLFFRTFFFHIQGVQGNNLASMKKCPRGARWVRLDTGVKRHIEYIAIAFYILA